MRIAIAVDGSDNALRAAERAIFIGKHLPEAVLEVIFVSDFNKAKDEWLLTQNPESLTLFREKKVKPVIHLAKGAGMEVNVVTLKGNPSQEIIRYVNDEDIAQLFIGSRGLNTLQEMVLGSVSHKVMKHVKCPVTIVK